MKGKTIFAKIFLTFLFSAISVAAQTTQFTYQGKLTDMSLAANGNYDIQFTLTDQSDNPIETITAANIPVTNGIFTVQLDFGDVFNGENRYLKIAVRRVGVSDFTPLNPRQLITSAPYAIKSQTSETSLTADTSINSQNLGGIPANQYVLETDPRLTDSRDPNAGSGNYVQNQNTSPQAANFSISGTGRADIFEAATQFNIGANRVLFAVDESTFGGIGAGTSNTGIRNTFFGFEAGRNNTSGFNNSFFGMRSGVSNTASGNSFFGAFTGVQSTGGNNSFFGASAGNVNLAGENNSFFGNAAGRLNQTGSRNSFFGTSSGVLNSNGADNSFFGYRSGAANNGGNQNVFVGTSSGNGNTTGTGNTFVGNLSGALNETGNFNTSLGAGAGVNSANLTYATAIGAGATVSSSNNIVLGRESSDDTVVVPGRIQLPNINDIGQNPLCVDGNNIVGLCQPPITAQQNDQNLQQKIELQQKQIENQQKQLEEQKLLIEGLRSVVCSQNPNAAFCQTEEESKNEK